MILSIFDGISLITHFFLWINKGIYWLAEKSYNLLIDIANVQLFTSDSLRDFGVRIYVLLGVLMLFKLSISLINYIVNPDSFDDKSKGFSKLIINICIVLVLIVTTPFIFSLAMKFQYIVLNDNLIPNLFLGMGSETNDEIDYSNAGERMSFLVFSSFFRPNPALFDDVSECKNYLFTTDDGETNSGFGLDFGNTLDGIKMKDDCAEVLKEATGTGFDDQIPEVFTAAYKSSNINLLTDTNLIKATSEVDGEKVSTFDFHGLIALIAGGLLAWIMVMFCFDIAVRTVKLVFLQLVAPIPIIAYADPKGNELFKKWLKQCTSTYLDLFIRLAAVFFAVFIVMKLPEAGIVISNGDEGTEPITNPLIYVFIIFGVLLFAKQLPKLIENITGIKMDGGFTLSPTKKLATVPGVSKTVGRVGGIIGGYSVGKQVGRKEAALGALTGAFIGGKGVTEKDGISGAFSKGATSSAKNLFGKDYHMWTAQDALAKFGRGSAEEQIAELKKKRNASDTIAQEHTTAANQYYKNAAETSDETEKQKWIDLGNEELKIAKKFQGNVEAYNSQISQLKTTWRIDDSTKKKLKSADEDLENYQKNQKGKKDGNGPNDDDDDDSGESPF